MVGKLPDNRQRSIYILVDIVSTGLAFFVFNIFRYYFVVTRFYVTLSLTDYLCDPKILAEELIVPFVLLGTYWISGFYNHPFVKSRLEELSQTFWSAFANGIFIYFVILLNDVGMKRRDYLLILVLVGTLFLFTYAGRYLVTYLTARRMRRHQYGRKTLIIGNSEKAHHIGGIMMASRANVPVDIIGYVNDEELSEGDNNVLSIANIEKICREQGVDQLVLAPETRDDSKVMMLVDQLLPFGLPLKIAPDTLSYVTSNITLRDILGTPMVDLTSPRISEFQKNLKRSLDVGISILAMLILSPLYLILYIAVKRSSPGPAIYSQERLGVHRKLFRIYKFRSMRMDSEPDGPCLSRSGDSRITPCGEIMRKYRLDELPQFWNILKGDMSLVGPRPEREYFVRQIIKKAPYYSLLYQVRPGLTSWGMVKFGYASNIDEMVERSRYDLIYMNNMSVSTDIKILIYTVRTVITGMGV